MALYHFECCADEVFLLIWKIEGQLVDLMEQLHPSFLPNVKELGVTSKKRLVQSISVRLALAALLDLLHLPIVPLIKGASDAPYLYGEVGYISFSHTSYFAAVAFSYHKPIGMDIEQVQDRLYNLQAKFIAEDKGDPLKKSTHELTLIWSAKEALYKLLRGVQVPPFCKIHVAPFQWAESGKLILYCDQAAYQLSYKQIRGEGIPMHFLVFVQHPCKQMG